MNRLVIKKQAKASLKGNVVHEAIENYEKNNINAGNIKELT